MSSNGLFKTYLIKSIIFVTVLYLPVQVFALNFPLLPHRLQLHQQCLRVGFPSRLLILFALALRLSPCVLLPIGLPVQVPRCDKRARYQ